MVGCSVCGQDLSGELGYTCTYCRESHCSEHRLPEKHDCVYQGVLKPPFGGRVDERSKYRSTAHRHGQSDGVSHRVERKRDRNLRDESSDDSEPETEDPESTDETDNETLYYRRRWDSYSTSGEGADSSPPVATYGSTSTGAAGKPHRNWEPDSKSPDVTPTGDIDREDKHPVDAEKSLEFGRDWGLILILAFLLVTIGAFIYATGLF